MRAQARRSNIYQGREKKKVKEASNRVTRHPEPTTKDWTVSPAPLQVRDCPFRDQPDHHLVSCPACEGFPE